MSVWLLLVTERDFEGVVLCGGITHPEVAYTYALVAEETLVYLKCRAVADCLNARSSSC